MVFHVQNEIRVRFECYHLLVTNIAKRDIMPDGWKMLFFNLKMISIFFCRRSLFGSKDRLKFLYDLLYKIVGIFG